MTTLEFLMDHADALVSLAGVIVGAVITVISQHWSGELERKHQLRIAAAERRLEAHQQAFSLWRKLIATVHNENEIRNVVIECQNWWDNNCLYLSPKARKQFNLAYLCAVDHKEYLKNHVDPKLVKENWTKITDAGEVIIKGVELPTLGENEARMIEEKTPN